MHVENFLKTEANSEVPYPLLLLKTDSMASHALLMPEDKGAASNIFPG